MSVRGDRGRKASRRSVENHEGVDQRYTVVIEEERIERGSGGVTVLEDAELSRQNLEIPAGDADRLQIDVTPTMPGDDLRLAFYLYRGEAPEAADSDSAYRHAFIQVEVVEGTSSGSSS
jgi:hypothetical protein